MLTKMDCPTILSYETIMLCFSQNDVTINTSSTKYIFIFILLLMYSFVTMMRLMRD